jgi:transposase InsO family protein
VGIHVVQRATRFKALELIRQGVREHFGGYRKDAAAGLVLHHDHGGQYMSDHFQREICFLGMTAPPAFVRQPEGNAYVSHCTSSGPCQHDRHFQATQ